VIRKETQLTASDNSDAKTVLCIHPNKKKSAFRRTSLGNFVKVTIKKKVSRRKNIKKRVNWCFVGATPRRIVRLSGEGLRFSRSKVILVDEKKKKIMGTLIKGVLPREARLSGASDIIKRVKRLI
jgi:ribosomal protein L14